MRWTKSDLAAYEARQSRSAVRPVETSVVERSAPLVKKAQGQQGGKGSVAVVVSLIACVRKEHDFDNICGGCKPIVDAIAETLGIDDGDKRIKFEYGQICTKGQTGVMVKIEVNL